MESTLTQNAKRRYDKLQGGSKNSFSSTLQWTGYAAAATAAVCTTNSAQGAVILEDARGYPQLRFPGTANTGTFTFGNRNFQTLQVNLNPVGGQAPASLQDSINDLTLRFSTYSSGGNIFFGVAGLGGDAALVAGTYNNYGLVTDGNFLINSGLNFGNFASVTGLPYNNGGSTVYLGVRLDINGNEHFGAIQLVVDTAPVGGSTFEITGIAFESTPGTPILTGRAQPIPEPSSLALLALGAAGISRLRKRRK